MPPAPFVISSFEGSNAKRYIKVTRSGKILSRDSRVCCRRWMRMQSAGIDLSAVIAAAWRYLGIEAKELARRFNVDHSALSQATQRVSRDPELPAATKTIQREPELERNQHWSNVPFIRAMFSLIWSLIFINFSPSSPFYPEYVPSFYYRWLTFGLSPR